MNKDDVILMADASGLSFYGMGKDRDKFVHYLAAFATLVAEREREACAKDCESINSIEDFYGERPELICAKAIRARGNT